MSSYVAVLAAHVDTIRTLRSIRGFEIPGTRTDCPIATRELAIEITNDDTVLVYDLATGEEADLD